VAVLFSNSSDKRLGNIKSAKYGRKRRKSGKPKIRENNSNSLLVERTRWIQIGQLKAGGSYTAREKMSTIALEKRFLRGGE
jgi:hypothetical protein